MVENVSKDDFSEQFATASAVSSFRELWMAHELVRVDSYLVESLSMVENVSKDDFEG